MTEQTAPLVPVEVDLRGLPFMPLDVVRLLDSDIFALSNGDEFKAAVALWGRSWLQVPAASLPDDDKILSHLSGAGGRWRKVKDRAMRGWVLCSDGRWYHPVVAEKALQAWRHRVAQRGRAAKRWQSHGNATGMPRHSPGSPTAMQGTVKGEGEGKKRSKSRARMRAIPLPSDFQVSERVSTWATEHGFSRLDEHLEAFKRKCSAKGYSYLDWDAAFMEAIREDWAKLRGNGRDTALGADRPSIVCISCKARAFSWTGGQCDPCWRRDQGLRAA